MHSKILYKPYHIISINNVKNRFLHSKKAVSLSQNVEMKSQSFSMDTFSKSLPLKVLALSLFTKFFTSKKKESVDKNKDEVLSNKFGEVGQKEFEKLSNELKNHPKFEMISKRAEDLNKYNILLIKEILDNPQLNENENIQHSINSIIHNTSIPIRINPTKLLITNSELYSNKELVESYNAIIRLINEPAQANIVEKFFSDKNLYSNKNLVSIIKNLVYYSRDERAQITDKILVNPDLYNNRIIINDIEDILYSANYDEQIDFVKNIFSKKELYSNQTLLKSLSNFISAIKDEKRLAFINDVLQDKKLLKQEALLNSLPRIISICIDNRRLDFLKDVIFNKRLYENKAFLTALPDIIKSMHNKEVADIKIQCLNKIYSQKEIFNNQNIHDYLGNILESIQNDTSANLLMYMLSKKELVNNINIISNLDKMLAVVFTPEQLDFGIRILDNQDIINNENLMKNIDNIMRYSITNAETPNGISQLTNLFISTPQLYENKFVVKNIDNILRNTDDSSNAVGENKKFDAQKRIIDYYIANEDKFCDAIYQKSLASILQFANEDTTINDFINYTKALKSAFDKKDLLCSNSTPNENSILQKFSIRGREIIDTINLIGLENFVHSFTYKTDGVTNFAIKMSQLKRKLSPESHEKLLLKINPKNSKRYKRLQVQIKKLKAGYNNIKNSDTPEALKDLQNRIANLTTKSKDILNGAEKLDPQSVLDKVKVLSALLEYDDKELPNAIKLLKTKTPQNEKAWLDMINYYIFDVIGFKYNAELSKRLNLSQSKFISEILTSNIIFKSNFASFLEFLYKFLQNSNQESFDKLYQNMVTKAIFQKNGISYKNWCNFDKNSNEKFNYTFSEVGELQHIQNDLEGTLMYMLEVFPPKISEYVLEKIKQEIGVELKPANMVADENLNALNISFDVVLCKDDKSLSLNELKKSLKIIKQIFDEDNLEQLDKILETQISENCDGSQINSTQAHDEFPKIYINSDSFNTFNNLIQKCYQKTKNVEALKSKNNIELVTRKVDMNDIKHSLFLGNHAHCCTAVGNVGVHQGSAPLYIKNKMFSAIELIANGESVGNSMCFVAKVDDKLALVLDNIELKAEYRYNNLIRDLIISYAKKISNELGIPFGKVYIGGEREKINLNQFVLKRHNIQILGNTSEDLVYIDIFSRRVRVKEDEIMSANLYEIP